jgi:hypothetical protein
VAAYATYSSGSGAILDRVTILRALRQMVLAHPALCVQLAGSHDKKPYFVRLPVVDVSDVLEYSEDLSKTVEEVLAAELIKPFPRSTTKPLWRVIVRSDNTVIFVWHHSIADGGCTHSFHAAFLSALNKKPGEIQKEESESNIVTVPAQITMAPTIEDRTSISVSFKTTCLTLYEAFTPASWQRLHKAWTGNPVVPKPSLDVHVRMRKIEPDAARKLVALCRENNCTITSFIHTLAVCVLSKLVTSQDKIAHKYKIFSTVVPISLRRFTGTSALDMCDQVTAYHAHPRIMRNIENYPPTKETFPWNTATEFGASLHKSFAKAREVIGTIGFIYKLGIAKKFFLDKLGKKREGTLVLSNVGVMPKDDLGETQRDNGELWEVDNVGFGQNDGVFGSAMKINMAGSPSGAINIAYTWGLSNLDLEIADAFIADMHSVIETIVL